jgi:hypothetical protein
MWGRSVESYLEMEWELEAIERNSRELNLPYLLLRDIIA